MSPPERTPTTAFTRWADVLVAARGGDETALALLLDTARSFAERHLGLAGLQPADVDDLASKVVERVLAGVRSGELEVSSFYEMVRYKALGALKDWRNRAEQRRTRTEEVSFRADLTQDPAAAMARKELSAAYRECVGELAERDREILKLRYGDGRSARDVGASMAMTAQTVRSRVFRALLKVRGCLQRKGFTDDRLRRDH